MRTKTSSTVAWVVVLCIAAYVYAGCKPYWQFDHLEQNAKRRITAPQLQSWATSLLAQHPPGHAKVADLGTNFPRQLLGLYHRPPGIIIYESRTNDSGLEMPAYVRLTWGGGFIGHCGFEIGPTNFFSYVRGTKWSDGVYFWRY